MKIKTEDLTGPALDWAVAKCSFIEGTARSLIAADVKPYSTSWQEGGPIIERERVYLNCLRKGDAYRTEVWEAWPYDASRFVHQGPTPLIAAMRCYVASKLGDIVDIPEEQS